MAYNPSFASHWSKNLIDKISTWKSIYPVFEGYHLPILSTEMKKDTVRDDNNLTATNKEHSWRNRATALIWIVIISIILEEIPIYSFFEVKRPFGRTIRSPRSDVHAIQSEPTPSSFVSFLTTSSHLLLGLPLGVFSIKFFSGTVRSNKFRLIRACGQLYLIFLIASMTFGLWYDDWSLSLFRIIHSVTDWNVNK